MLDKITGTAVAIAMSAPAAAQTLPNDFPAGDLEQRASVAMVIPFGGNRDASESRPRIELQLDQRQRNLDLTDPRDLGTGIEPRTVRIGYTVAGDPQFMLNGRSLAPSRDRHNLSAKDGVLIGLGVLAAAALGLYIVVMSQGPTD
jgi:hypothetical protein